MMTRPDFGALTALVPDPGARADLTAIAALWPEIPAMDACPQSPVHHAEGDVGTHTRMVVAALLADPDWAALPPTDRALSFWAAVLHDVGKPGATVAEADGRITSRGHSRLGAVIARRLLRAAGAPFAWREQICGILLAHQLPFRLLERDGPERLAVAASWRCRGDLLHLQAKADAAGRVCADRARLLDNVALSRLLFEEAGCLTAPYPFANDESRVAFFEREDRDHRFAAHAAHPCTATVMAGLPGAGKDSWLARHRPDLPVVSLDALRARMGAQAGGGGQGRVAQAAQQQARGHLRAGRDFAWNGTNVTRLTRGKVLRLCRDYGARVEIVYLEPSDAVLAARNAGREAQVPRAVLEKLSARLEPPGPWEAHKVTVIAP